MNANLTDEDHVELARILREVIDAILEHAN